MCVVPMMSAYTFIFSKEEKKKKTSLFCTDFLLFFVRSYEELSTLLKNMSYFFRIKIGEPIPVILAPFDFKLKFLSLF